MKYLNLSGLSYFLNKIKTYLTSSTYLNSIVQNVQIHVQTIMECFHLGLKKILMKQLEII